MSTKRRASLLVRANGASEEVYPKGDKWTLDELQAHVGGFIEPISGTNLPSDQILLVNEEGLLERLPANRHASLIARRPIVGDALIIPAEQFE